MNEFLMEWNASVYLIKAYSLENAEHQMYVYVLASDPATRQFVGTYRSSRLIHQRLMKHKVRNVPFSTI
jgi:hypothetical protein